MSSVIRYADQNVTEIDMAAIPEIVPVIPLRNAVILPGVLLPIFVGRTESVDLIEKHGKPGALIALFTQKSPTEEEVEMSDLYTMGTLAEVHRVMPMGEGGYQVFLQGVQKVELKELTQLKPHLLGRILPVGEIQDQTEEQFREFQAHVFQYAELHPAIPQEIVAFVKRITNPAALANQLIFFSQKDLADKIESLRIHSVAEKLRYVQDVIIEETSRLRMEREVREKVEKDTSRMQKEFYLRKQMETIRKELGEEEEDEADELEKQFAEKWLPDSMRKAVEKEMKRYRKAQEGPHSGGLEANQIRNWLELVLELPWEDPEGRRIHLGRAREVLDEDHEGLGEVKEKILEFLAVEKQTGGSKAPILCLVGPPGVGKTSLARSIARAMDRPLVRSALGGVRDEAEIRGHRRTYVGALPGKIVASMKKVGRRDPVFLLDEIDKTGSSYHGDPSAALLEVLDPEQNHAFEDHYLGHPYDLSRVLFIATANSMDSIPPPLLDRMEVVQLSGYTLEEKREIAKKHLLPEILRQLKMPEDAITLTDDAIRKVVCDYTREAGVRSLKRRLESLARKAVREILEKVETSPDRATQGSIESSGTVEGSGTGASPEVIPGGESHGGFEFPRIVYDNEGIRNLLGREKHARDVKENSGIPGVAIGLAWTPVGGDILFIEAASYPGKGNLKLSGQLGEVMKESAHAALSFLRSRASHFRLNPDIFANVDIHIHIPSGAIPKDGPSAGVTLLTALLSLFTGRPVAEDLAMTGEISLRGRILPVGGIKEKVIAAMAAGIHTVLLPEKNQAEFEEIPEHIRNGIHVEYFSDMLDLLRRAVPMAEATHGA